MSSLLEILKSKREEDVQKYLTRHPEILLNAFTLPWRVRECIPKFRFGAEFVSDFVLVEGQSYRYHITLIELEPPTERIFTQAGKFAKRLNDAIGQISDWFNWIHENEHYFRQSLSKLVASTYGSRQIQRSREGIPVGNRRHIIEAKIIIGRRSFLTEEDNKRKETIYDSTSGRIEIIPYDRLVEIEQHLTDPQ
jgi:hypothetical protein